jgi:hypothetical protein
MLHVARTWATFQPEEAFVELGLNKRFVVLFALEADADNAAHLECLAKQVGCVCQRTVVCSSCCLRTHHAHAPLWL